MVDRPLTTDSAAPWDVECLEHEVASTRRLIEREAALTRSTIERQGELTRAAIERLQRAGMTIPVGVWWFRSAGGL